ncbi:glycosyltransferase involved in cell wall biosynthesis [Ochrobactrum daejeonense]|uniref:Glycosyltransferase involved in cell wall biosynthesis n=1 Tax=Brucella daejeonensis TaxID=659015 RepID=A0A7W9AXD9_9HYPH|nr:glycosyltransferase family 4 protein [Brucella daejeonensis]MBB5702353.1 glycosyltransferase involved in cell wall biosynthesis [Brucella daejeonensis]
MADKGKRPRVMMLGLRGVPNVQGGVEKHVEELARLYIAKGWDVEVVGRSPYLDRKQPYVWEGIQVTPVWAPTSMKFEAIIHTVIGILRAGIKRPDVLHIHAIGPALATPLARLFGLPTVVTHHGFDYNRQKWGRLARTMLKLGEWCGMRFANARIAVSNDIAQTMQQRYDVPVTFIPNGVTLRPASHDRVWLEKYDLSPGRYIALVARIVPEKRQLDLIEAFAKLSDPSLKLALIGSAEYTAEYAATVRARAEAVPGVVLTGALRGEELSAVFSQAALFVLPSSHEGMPIALLEAMGYGLNVLASDITANIEVGLSKDSYFPLGDIEALKDAMRGKIDRPLSPDQSQDLIDRIARDYSWSGIADRTLAVYQSVLK